MSAHRTTPAPRARRWVALAVVGSACAHAAHPLPGPYEPPEGASIRALERHDRARPKGTRGRLVDIEASITTPGGVADAALLYSLDRGPFVRVPLEGAGTEYSVFTVIPEGGRYSYVEYCLTATDAVSHRRFYWPSRWATVRQARWTIRTPNGSVEEVLRYLKEEDRHAPPPPNAPLPCGDD